MNPTGGVSKRGDGNRWLCHDIGAAGDNVAGNSTPANHPLFPAHLGRGRVSACARTSRALILRRERAWMEGRVNFPRVREAAEAVLGAGNNGIGVGK